jgi:hypothetical protein
MSLVICGIWTLAINRGPFRLLAGAEGTKGHASRRLVRPPISSILVVENDSLYLQGLVDLLESEGLKVYGAASANEALQELRLDHEERLHVDMALIDLNLSTEGGMAPDCIWRESPRAIPCDEDRAYVSPSRG